MKDTLVVDIGNSYCKMGIFKQAKLVAWYEVPTNKKNLSLTALRKLLISQFQTYNVTGAIVGSVVKGYVKIFVEAIQQVFNVKPYLLTDKTKLNFKFNKNINRNEVGQDLIALATYCATKADNVIGFSFGTASVGICLINKILKGAIITAGLSYNVKSLVKEADMIDNNSFNIFREQLIGTNTKAAIEAGIYHLRNGFINSFYQTCQSLCKKNNTALHCVISGHEAFKIKSNFNYEVNPKAILFGYYQIYLLNCA